MRRIIRSIIIFIPQRLYQYIYFYTFWYYLGTLFSQEIQGLCMCMCRGWRMKTEKEKETRRKKDAKGRCCSGGRGGSKWVRGRKGGGRICPTANRMNGQVAYLWRPYLRYMNWFPSKVRDASFLLLKMYREVSWTRAFCFQESHKICEGSPPLMLYHEWTSFILFALVPAFLFLFHIQWYFFTLIYLYFQTDKPHFVIFFFLF